MHSATKKLFTGDISSRTDFPMSVLNESWRSSRRRHYNNAFLASLSPAQRGERFRPATCCCDKNRPDGSRRGLVLVPIDSTNYSQTRRYRGPFSRTLFSRSIDQLLFHERRRRMVRRARRRNKILRFAGQCKVIISCIYNPVHSARRFNPVHSARLRE